MSTSTHDTELIRPDQMADHCGRVVRLSGRYKAELNPAHKALSLDAAGQATSAECVAVLLLDDGTCAELYDRPVEEARRLDGAVVVVTGKLAPPDPPFEDDDDDDEVAQEEPMYSFLDVLDIELVGS